MGWGKTGQETYNAEEHILAEDQGLGSLGNNPKRQCCVLGSCETVHSPQDPLPNHPKPLHRSRFHPLLEDAPTTSCAPCTPRAPHTPCSPSTRGRVRGERSRIGTGAMGDVTVECCATQCVSLGEPAGYRGREGEGKLRECREDLYEVFRLLSLWTRQALAGTPVSRDRRSRSFHPELLGKTSETEP